MVLALKTRGATSADTPFLWRMLVLAAWVPEAADDVERAKDDGDLGPYVEGFGRAGDLGVIALHEGEPVGAAWARLLVGAPKPSKVWTPDVPELAIAVMPSIRGRGAGSLLLRAFLDAARPRFTAVLLTVREDNPAVRLYERHGFVIERRLTNRVGGVSLVMRHTFRGRDS